jgi:hypothetical protein
MNLIIHNKKPYKKGNTYLTLWFFTFIKYDVMVALNRAGNREVNRLYFPQTNNGFKKTGTN